MLLSLLASSAGRSIHFPRLTVLLTHCQRTLHTGPLSSWLTTLNTVPLAQQQCASFTQSKSSATAATPWQPVWQHRRFSAAAPAQALTLKTALRQLYKRVHPDLFADYPAEQAENERSFKLLQDYLHQARNPSTGVASRSAYHFRFFLIPQQPLPGTWADSDDEAAGSDTSDSPQFELVQLVLVPPPPPRSQGPSSSATTSSGSGSGPLSAGARQGLLKLLKMCGFEDVVTEAEDEEGGGQDIKARLTTFLPEAAEVVRQHESGPTKHETKVANMRAAFRLARGVVAGFQPGMFTGPEQIDHLQRLADAFDLLSDAPPDLSGLHILICGRTALDSQGTLCLDAAADVDDWAAFLGGVDPEYARDKKASAAAVRGLESKVAAAVGVRMLFTAASYLMTHEYRAFLERMAAYAADHGPIKGAASGSSSSSSGASKQGEQLTVASTPVYVAPTYQPAEQQQHAVVHEVVGYIQVPMQASAQQVYNTIQNNASAALAILTKRAEEQAELSELTASVRNRLGLRRLLKDDIISMQDFRNACRRLMINRDALLASNIEGLSIRVSDKNRVAADGSLVDIAWDFDM